MRLVAKEFKIGIKQKGFEISYLLHLFKYLKKWIIKFNGSIFPIHNACKPYMVFFYCLHYLQSFYDCFLPFVAFAYLLWLLPTIYNDLLYLVDFNFQAYFIFITIFEQLPSCGNKIHLTPKVK